MGPWEKYQQPNGLGRPIIHEAAPQPTPQTPEARANTVANTRRTNTLLPLDVATAKAGLAKGQAEAVEARRKADLIKMQPEIMDVNQTLENVIGNAMKARNLSRDGWFATGFGAKIAKSIGGTPANDVEGYITPIASNVAFDKLQRIRQTSPTGGAVGNVSDRDMELLKGTIADLNIGQSDAKFQESMSNVVKAYGRVLMKVPGGREIARKNGWFGQKKPQQQRQKARVIDFNDLPE